MTWLEFLGILTLVLLGWAWYANLQARELANSVAVDTCAHAGVQLLDGTVSVLRVGLTRSATGTLVFRRTYVFDYSEDGATRRRGFVVLTGLDLDSVGLGPRPVT